VERITVEGAMRHSYFDSVRAKFPEEKINVVPFPPRNAAVDQR